MLLETVRGVLPDWPGWALDVLLLMSALLIFTVTVLSFYRSDGANTSRHSDAKKHGEKHLEFDKFRKQYLAVYLVIMLADWM